MFCSFCGTKIPDNAVRCSSPSCGRLNQFRGKPEPLRPPGSTGASRGESAWDSLEGGGGASGLSSAGKTIEGRTVRRGTSGKAAELHSPVRKQPGRTDLDRSESGPPSDRDSQASLGGSIPFLPEGSQAEDRQSHEAVQPGRFSERKPDPALEDAAEDFASLPFLEDETPQGPRGTPGGGDSDDLSESLPFLDDSRSADVPESRRRQAPRTGPEAAEDEDGSQASSSL